MSSRPGSGSRHIGRIETFFARGFAVDLYLPDGWYGGRPMENRHGLTFAVERPARLILEFDERILLTFTGERLSVEPVTTDVLDRSGTPAVEIAGYDQLVVDARLYGSDRAVVSTYDEGVVLLVSDR